MHTIERIQFGELESVLVRPQQGDCDRLVVLCHGYGAPGTDLVPIGMEMIDDGTSGVAFAFPAAPLIPDMPLEMECRAWWPIDVERLVEATQTGKLDQLRHEFPEDMPVARDKLMSWLRAMQEHVALSDRQTMIGGFSQGAMLATEATLHGDIEPAGVCLLSGTLLCEDRWRSLAGKTQSLKVLQSHGTMDPILPYSGATDLRDLLTECGHEVDFVSFDGMHQIPSTAIDRLNVMIEESRSG